MSKRRLVLMCASAVLLARCVLGQVPAELRETAAVTVVPKQVVHAFLEPIKCDAHSSVYYRVYPGTDDERGWPLMRISPEGKAFVFPTLSPGGQKRGIIDFAPRGDGGVVLLSTDYGTGRYLNFLDEKGELESESKLPGDIEPLQLAVSPLPSPQIFLSGLLSRPGLEGTQTSTAIAGIFNSKGVLQREISRSSDIQPGGPANPSAQRNYEEVVGLSSAQSSGNGNFILARLPSNGPIYVISPAGQELNVLRPAIPDGASLSSVKVDGNTVAALYIVKLPGSTQNEISDVFISLRDTDTGEEVGTVHTSSPRFGAALACYQAGVFTFLSTDPQSEEFQLVRAVAR